MPRGIGLKPAAERAFGLPASGLGYDPAFIYQEAAMEQIPDFFDFFGDFGDIFGGFDFGSLFSTLLTLLGGFFGGIGGGGGGAA